MVQASILLVDDDERALRTNVCFLESDGYQLITADGAAGAISTLSAHRIDLIISDVMMPGCDGFEFCTKIKRHPDYEFTPVMLVTVLHAEEDVVRGLEAGADEFISKPVHRNVLRARTRVLLRIRDNYRKLALVGRSEEDIRRERIERFATGSAFTPREREVFELLIVGRGPVEIATALNIARSTAKFHLSNVLKKIGAESRADLLRILL